MLKNTGLYYKKNYVLMIYAGYAAASGNDLFSNALKSRVMCEKNELDIHLPGTELLYTCI